MRGQWESWMDEEDRYVADERPATHADPILPWRPESLDKRHGT